MSERICVRKLEQQDLQTRVEWMNTESIYAQMPLRIPVSLSETQRWFGNNLLNERRYDFVFVRELETSSILVAMAGLVDIDMTSKRAELYIMVNPSKTSQGIGTRALRWLCNFGFAHLGLFRIFLFTVGSNSRARAFYERTGFLHEGTLRKHAVHHGKLVDRHVHGLLRSEWESLDWHEQEVKFFM